MTEIKEYVETKLKEISNRSGAALPTLQEEFEKIQASPLEIIEEYNGNRKSEIKVEMEEKYKHIRSQ